jgi:hypothetical protein
MFDAPPAGWCEDHGGRSGTGDAAIGVHRHKPSTAVCCHTAHDEIIKIGKI